jgi:3-oxoacyl-[acyl-carrier-protein] synthase-3
MFYLFFVYDSTMKNFDITGNPVIIGVGSYLPSDVVTNDELIARTGMNSTDEDIRRLTGIGERRFSNGELPSELGIVAVKHALESANISPDEVGALYASTITRDMVAPDVAVIMHGKLGLPETSLAVDLGAACAGGVYALHAAVQCATAEGRPTIAVGLGKMTPVTNFSDRRSGILFGDGAGAFVVGNRRGAQKPAFAFLTAPDVPAIHIPGQHEGLITADPEHPAGKIAMQGRNVAAHATHLMPRAAITAAQKAGVYDERNDRIDWSQVTLVPHQANGNLIERVGEALQAPKEKVVVTVDQHGNTSAASIPLALDHAIREGRFEPGKRHRLLFTTIGAGMVAGAAVMELDLTA